MLAGKRSESCRSQTVKWLCPKWAAEQRGSGKKRSYFAWNGMARSPGSCRGSQRTAGDLGWQQTASPSAEIWHCEGFGKKSRGSINLEDGGRDEWGCGWTSGVMCQSGTRWFLRCEIAVSIATVKKKHVWTRSGVAREGAWASRLTSICSD